MAGSCSDYAENKILDHIVGKTSFTMPTAFIALSTADPLDDGSGLAEPSGGSYARVSTSSSDWNAASNGSNSNANAITFPQATSSWGTITHFAIFDAASGGNMLIHGNVDTSKSIDSGDTAKFSAGELILTMS